jgi:hypothetical protein
MALIEACAQGRIRALWLGYYDPPCPLIPKMDWIGADIDLNNDRVIKANGECMAYVGFSRDDLEGWLASSDLPGIPLGSPPTESPQRKNPTDGMIRAKIREVYSEEKAAGRRVPNINQTPKLVRKKLNADGYVTSDKNIKKIADEADRRPAGFLHHENRTHAGEQEGHRICDREIARVAESAPERRG